MVNESDPGQDRPRGILSTADRQYLLDPEAYAEDHSTAAMSMRRRDIRERVQHGILDFSLLFDTLDEQHRGKIVTSLDEDGQTELRESIDAALALLYELCWVDGWDFRERLQRAAEAVYSHRRRPEPEPMVVGEVVFDVPRRPLKADKRVYEKGLAKLEELLAGDVDDRRRRSDPLTDREVRILWERGDDEVTELLKEYRRWKKDMFRDEDRESWRKLARADVDDEE